MLPAVCILKLSGNWFSLICGRGGVKSCKGEVNERTDGKYFSPYSVVWGVNGKTDIHSDGKKLLAMRVKHLYCCIRKTHTLYPKKYGGGHLLKIYMFL
jgi:hypothetical protein